MKASLKQKRQSVNSLVKGFTVLRTRLRPVFVTSLRKETDMIFLIALMFLAIAFIGFAIVADTFNF